MKEPVCLATTSLPDPCLSTYLSPRLREEPFLFAALVSLGLGIGGLLQKERKKVFAILGTVFSAAIILCTVALIALGLAME